MVDFGAKLREFKEKKALLLPQTRTFELTDAQLDDVCTTLYYRYGIHIVGREGEINTGGFKALYGMEFDHKGSKKTALSITLVSLPILISPENAWSVIVTTVNAAIKKFNC